MSPVISPSSPDDRRRAPRGPLSRRVKVAIAVWIAVMVVVMWWWLSIPRP